MLDTFKGYIVKIEKLIQNKTKLVFKNVPIDCPNIELENLCNAYGIKDGSIYKQFLTVPTEKNREVRLPTTTRTAMVKLHPGKTFQNFYWLGGLHPTSRDTKITVIHHGQTEQCANCLLTEEEGCPAMGIGKNYKEIGTRITPLAEYFKN